MSCIIKLFILEVSKLIQFCIIWALPLVLAKYTGCYYFLLLLIFSVLVNSELWRHYIVLSHIVFNKEEKYEGEDLSQESNEKRS